MEALDFKDLFSLKGKPGVWQFKKKLTSGMILFHRFKQPDVYATVKVEVCSAIGNHIIYTNEGNLPVEKVIDWLFQDSTKPDFSFEFDKLSTEKKKAIMEKYAPNYDSTAFKEYHMSRIFKWFNELHSALHTTLDNGEKTSVL